MTNLQRFHTCRLNNTNSVDAVIAKIVAAKEKYAPIVKATGVPWFFIGILHLMETSLRFDRHLHNGDPLNARTTHVPAGRPLAGQPPFTWEQSAIDALAMQGLAGTGQAQLIWNLENMLERMERYNGLGYRKRDMASPYLWAGSQHYTKGKFVTDGKFDPKAVSKQIGGAVILCRMFELNIIQL